MWEKLKKMNDTYWILGIIGLYLLLQLFILPNLGYDT